MAVVVTALASGGAVEPETAVIAVPVPNVVEPTQNPVLIGGNGEGYNKSVNSVL